MDNKGKIDPMVIAGLFVTLMVVWALSPLIKMVITGIADTFGGTAGTIVMLTPAVIILAIIVTFWEYQERQ